MSEHAPGGEGLSNGEEKRLADLLRDAVAVRGLFERVIQDLAPRRAKVKDLSKRDVWRVQTSRTFPDIPITRPDGLEQLLAPYDTTTEVQIRGIDAVTTIWGCGYLLKERVGRKVVTLDNSMLPSLMQVRYGDGTLSEWHFAQIGNGSNQMENAPEAYELALYRLAAALPKVV